MSPNHRDRPFRLDGVDSRRLTLPLATPLVTGRERYQSRDLLLLRVRIRVDGRTLHGWGEAAPLPGWNDADLDELAGIAAQLGGCGEPRSLTALFNDHDLLDQRPALRFGIECGVLDALARADGVALADVLVAGRGVEPASPVAVQRTLGDCDAPAAIDALTAAQEAGYTHAKLKVGAREARDDLARIFDIVTALPELIVRLDANGAWGVDEALSMLATLPKERVEWVEQPVPDVEIDALLERYDRSGPAIAIDESCAEPGRAEALLATGRLGAVVVKPAALGGLDRAAGLFEQAVEAGAAVMISNLMESAVGRAAVAHLAAAWPDLPGPHGLATGAWFARDVAPDADRIDGGRLHLRPGAGLGFEPGYT